MALETEELNVVKVSKKDFDNQKSKPDNYLFFVYDEYKDEDGKTKTRIQLYKGAVLVSGDVKIQENNTSLAFYPRIVAAGTIEPVINNDVVEDFKIDMLFGNISINKVYVQQGDEFIGKLSYLNIIASVDDSNSFKEILILANRHNNTKYFSSDSPVNKTGRNEFMFFISQGGGCSFIALGINL